MVLRPIKLRPRAPCRAATHCLRARKRRGPFAARRAPALNPHGGAAVLPIIGTPDHRLDSCAAHCTTRWRIPGGRPCDRRYALRVAGARGPCRAVSPARPRRPFAPATAIRPVPARRPADHQLAQQPEQDLRCCARIGSPQPAGDRAPFAIAGKRGETLCRHGPPCNRFGAGEARMHAARTAGSRPREASRRGPAAVDGAGRPSAGERPDETASTEPGHRWRRGCGHVRPATPACPESAGRALYLPGPVRRGAGRTRYRRHRSAPWESAFRYRRSGRRRPSSQARGIRMSSSPTSTASRRWPVAALPVAWAAGTAAVLCTGVSGAWLW